jgi:hypothetical protein
MVAIALAKEKTITIPKALMYEMLDGIVVPYRGYQKVLAKKVKIEDIMGSSGLQSLVIDIIAEYLRLKFKKYRFMSSEVGLHLNHKNNLAADIAMFSKSALLQLKESNYIEIPPRAVIEIDTKADQSVFETESEYFRKKTQKLLDFGVELVIWFFTADQKMIIARPNQPWLITNFDYDFDFFGENMNLKKVLENEGLEF